MEEIMTDRVKELMVEMIKTMNADPSIGSSILLDEDDCKEIIQYILKLTRQ